MTIVQRAKRVAVTVVVALFGGLALMTLPSPWGVAVWGLAIFAMAPILLWENASAPWQRRALWLGCAGAFVAGLMYGDTGFTGLERVLLLSYFVPLVIVTYISARASRIGSSEAPAK